VFFQDEIILLKLYKNFDLHKSNELYITFT